MFPPPKVHKWLCFSAALLLMAFCVQAQQVRKFTWDDVQSLPLLKETRFITGGYTSDRLLLIRDQPIAIWRKVDSVTTVPEIPVLPPGEKLYKAAVHNGVLFFITLGPLKAGEYDVPVHLYKSTKGVEDAKKVLTTGPFVWKDTYESGIWPEYGRDCFLLPTESAGVYYLVLANLPSDIGDAFFQEVRTFYSQSQGTWWNTLEYFEGLFPFSFHYKFTGQYYLSTYSHREHNLISYNKTSPINDRDTIMLPKKNISHSFNDPLNKNQSWTDVVAYKDTLFCFEYGNTSKVIKVNLKNRKVLPASTYPIDDIEWIRPNGSYYYLFSPTQGLFRAHTPTGTPEKIYPLDANAPALINRVSFLSNNELLLSTYDQSLLYLNIGQPVVPWDHLLPRTLPESIVPDPVSAVAKFNQLHFAIHENKDATPLAFNTNGQGLNAEFFPNRNRSYLIQRHRDQFHLTEWDGQNLLGCTGHSLSHHNAFVNSCKEKYYHFKVENYRLFYGEAFANCSIQYNNEIKMGFHVAHMNDNWNFLLKFDKFFGGAIKNTELYLYDETKLSGRKKNFPNGFFANLWVYINKHLFLYNKDLVACTDTTCYVTNDGAENWKDIPNLLGSVKRAYSSQDSFLYASTSDQSGFYISADWGQNWVQFNNYIPAHSKAFAISGNQAYWFTKRGFFTADATDLLKLLNKIKVSNKTAPPLAELQPYPNPVVAGQEIKFPDLSDGPLEEVQLYDFSGKFLQTWHSPNSISIAAPGMYWLKVKARNQLWAASKVIVISN